MRQGAHPPPQPLVLRWTIWQRSPQWAVSVLGVGLCSATDWGAGYSNCTPLAASQGGPSLDSRQGAGHCPPTPTASRARRWAGGRPSSYCTGSSTRTGTHWAASAQSPWVPLPDSPPGRACRLGPGGGSCACAGAGQHGPPPPAWRAVPCARPLAPRPEVPALR